MVPDFGIKTAMNMCGNEEIRQTRSQSNAITPTHIDRQVSRPSDTFVFGLSDAEDLRYISAHLKGDRNVTLQGRDHLTVKVIGSEKLTWERLINRCGDFLERYAARDYIELFPSPCPSACLPGGSEFDPSFERTLMRKFSPPFGPP